ncbi:hypothetical protein DNTS_021928 [Danionella cerebrum]|uniref:Protein-lysine N-methyltransferase SMYD4 n=1 Tax=Danionella cerebrum TaxID=2873325 RepID=A0A553RDJ6_9TELE|nr:hypothetical protein DNTS_021928 [Danionella translucida]
MDLPCLDWVHHVEEKWAELSSEEKERFNLLTDIENLFNHGLLITCSDDVKSLSTISKTYSVQKCNVKASEFRLRGNLFFKLKDYGSAALHYSKGVCHADNCTEELSLCFANRSAALFYHGHYKACLEDIQRSLEAGYPNKLQEKLKTRRAACLAELKKHECSKTLNSDLQTNNRNLVNLHGVSVYFCPNKGRHVLATENKSAGEVLLQDEAFCSVLIPSKKTNIETSETDETFGTEDQHCHHCLRQSLSFVPCPKCSYARYCGERCRTDAWGLWHQWECTVGADLLATGVLGHLALRVALKAGEKEIQNLKKRNRTYSSLENDALVQLNLGDNCRNDPEHSNCFHGSSYQAIHSLLPHIAQHSPASRFLQVVTIAVLFRKLQGGPTPWASSKDEGVWQPEMSLLGATALRHLMQLRCNSQAVTALKVREERGSAVQSSSEIRIATAIFPVLSLLNHSCSPNTSLSFSTGFQSEPLNQSDAREGQTEHAKASHGAVMVTVRAAKDLPAGQEILHCYGTILYDRLSRDRMEVKQRQFHLQEQYFFSCSCQACRKDLAEGSPDAKEKMAAELKCVKCGKPLQVCSEGYVCSWSSCGHRIESPGVEIKLQALQRLLDQAVRLLEREKLDDALTILKSALSQSSCILTDTHPLRGQLADCMARVHATRERKREREDTRFVEDLLLCDLKTGEWSLAASHLKCSLIPIQAQFGEDSIELGRQLFKLTQLYFNGQDCVQALAVMPRARQLLSLHCDPHCEELMELEEMEHCLQALL